MNGTILNSYSGIKTHQFGLDSVSNNIANVNTTGYRESRPEFETLFAPKAIGSGPTSNEVNMGVTASSNAISTQNGNYKASDGEFDLAYQGKGWFVVGENKEGEMEVKKDGFSQKQQNYFTRDGSFGKDAQGYLVNAKGYYLYGVNLGKIKDGMFISSPENDEKNLASEKLSPLQIPQNLRYKPLESTEVKLAINLNKTQNPINAYEAFSANGTIDEAKLLGTDVNIFFVNQKSLDSQINNKAEITLTDSQGEKKTFVFTYGDEGENSFHTLGELKALIQNKTGLDLNIIIKDKDSQSPSIALELSNPSFTQSGVETKGSFFEALGMDDAKEKKIDAIAPYNPTHTYSPNTLVSYLGITFRKIGAEGSSNPVENPQEWEIIDSSAVKPFDEAKTYNAGDVVSREGNIYLMDQQNQFIKIGEAKTFSIPEFNPQEQYGTDTIVQYQNKLYKRIAPQGNSNPLEDQESWKEISLGKITSNALEIPHTSSSVEIYDENGKKYHLISEYHLIGGYDPKAKESQKWEVKSFIQDIQSGAKVSEERTHYISFDESNSPIAPKIELDFKGKKISYDISGTDEKKSSDELYSDSEVTSFVQNGSSEGILERTAINDNGIIYLKFSNGKQEAMGRVGIVAFTNDQGLSKMGGNLFGIQNTFIGGEQQPRSGNPILGWNENGNLTMGNIKQGYLETSNVNIGNALTELILMQRGYSMNAKSFTTGDEMIKEAINLKR